MFKEISEKELRESGCTDKPICVKVQYTYYRDDSIKPTVDCWLPPVGWVRNPFVTGKPWIKTGVYHRSHKKADCFWEIDPRFAEYHKTWELWEEEEDLRNAKLRKSGKYDAYGKPVVWTHPACLVDHPELTYLKSKADVDTFKKECYIARFAGFWFHNNGQDVYLTGDNWTYLSVFKMDEPIKFFMSDVNLHYFWSYCEEDPECFGMNLIAKRRSGKTYISGCLALNRCASRPFFHVGIQSKTEQDAKNAVFNKAIIKPFKKFPKFFRPVCNLPKGSAIPASGLIFNSGTMSGRAEELESFIDFKSSGVRAYDGEKLNLGIFDEIGKTTEVSVYERWRIVKYCFLNTERKIIGKAICTTTVEEMEQGGEAFMMLWKDSVLTERKGKQTKSGLYNYFTPAFKTLNVNQYGLCDEEANKKELIAALELLKDDPASYSSVQRQDPMCEEDCFILDGDKCLYNAMNINNRKRELMYAPPAYTEGNFEWVDDKFGGDVWFRECKGGRFKLGEAPPEELRNLKIERNGKVYPGNTSGYTAGTDTYDQQHVNDENGKRHSKGAYCVVKRPNPLNSTAFDGGPVCFYLNRPDCNTFYEDTLKASIYYGCFNLIETNKPKCYEFYFDWGFEGYVPQMPGAAEGVRGVNNSGRGTQINTAMSEHFEAYVLYDINSMFYLELLDQLASFDPTSTTKFDAAMAFGYALLLAKNIAPRKKNTLQKKRKDMGSFLRSNQPYKKPSMGPAAAS